MLKKFGFFFIMLFLSIPAHAEGNCPPGYYQIGGKDVQGCAPYHVPKEEDPIDEPDVGPLWETRWGAVAADHKVGAYGASEKQSSKQASEQLAIEQCQARGGKSCRVYVASHNQCRALAWGDDGMMVAGEATLELAKQGALEDCGKTTTDCRIYYSGCSYSERIR